jgi:GNAT superfamily N-acetyltransferase
MLQPEFTIADARAHRDELVELNVEYMSWVLAEIEGLFGVSAREIVGMTAREYGPTVIDKVCGDPPPRGVFYLVKVEHTLAGMGGLRSLGNGVAEVKRIYFRQAFRGMKLGDLMLKRLLADAKTFGYQKACLDTALFMKSAHRVYESNGFVDRPAYEGTEVPSAFHAHWRFMERAL